jgi:hypothetical protein
MASSHQPTQIVSRHRTSEGVVTYARRADGGMSVSVEPWASSTRPLAGHRGATCAATPDVRRAQRPRDGSVPPARIALVVTGPRPHRSALVAARRIALARGADLFLCEGYSHRRIRWHMCLEDLADHEQQLHCARLVLTHMSPEALVATNDGEHVWERAHTLTRAA